MDRTSSIGGRKHHHDMYSEECNQGRHGKEVYGTCSLPTRRSTIPGATASMPGDIQRPVENYERKQEKENQRVGELLQAVVVTGVLNGNRR